MVKSLQIDKSLNLIKYIFYITGMNTFVKKSERDPIQHRNHRIRYFIIFGLLIIESLFGYKFIADGPGFTSITYLMPCLTVTTLSCVKSIFFVTRDDLVNEFIQLLRNLEKEHDDDDNDVKRVFEQETVFLNHVLRVMDVLVKMMMIAFPLMPILAMVIVYYNTGNWELQLPYMDIYPFDALNIKVWRFVYFRQIITVVTVLLQMSGADYIFCIGCSFLRIQFRLLGHNIERIVPDARIQGNLMDNEEFREKFKKLVLWHHDVIRGVNMLDELYSKSTLLNISTSALLICLSGFNITAIDDIPLIISFISFLAVSLGQIFTLCYFADLLMDSSLDVNEAVYNCKWYLAVTKFCKMLHFIQMRSQKPCKITAYRFTDVNLRTFMKIMSTSWSYFCLLRTMYR